ncbi:DUF7686 domain-containing protein [Trinickia sp.]|uniref:DUF7686 domain-containing protein n=1 Tax=Trinickia sp. TaxID=2571163 RepID=UPI003BEEF075
MIDYVGESHQFHFQIRLQGDGVALDAFELRGDLPAGGISPTVRLSAACRQRQCRHGSRSALSWFCRRSGIRVAGHPQ